MCVLRTAYTGQLFMLPLVNMFVLEKERDWTLVNGLPMKLLLRFFSLVLLLLAWQCSTPSLTCLLPGPLSLLVVGLKPVLMLPPSVYTAEYRKPIGQLKC